MSDPGWVKFSTSGSMAIWSCGGAWTIDHATRLSRDLAIPAEAKGKAALIDLAAIDQLDTSGAWLIRRNGNALVVTSQYSGLARRSQKHNPRAAPAKIRQACEASGAGAPGRIALTILLTASRYSRGAAAPRRDGRGGRPGSR